MKPIFYKKTLKYPNRGQVENETYAGQVTFYYLFGYLIYRNSEFVYRLPKEMNEKVEEHFRELIDL